MNAYVVLFLAFPVLAFATDCSVLSDGHYEISCKSYVACSGGNKTTIECTEGQVYNNATKVCDDESKVGPPCGLIRDCKSLADGTYADLETACTSYYTCYRGTYFGHNYCGGDLVFDEAEGICNWKDNVKPPCGTKV